MVSRDDFFEVKQVGTIHNASDFGTRPLSQQRLKFLLRKCNEIDGDGNRVREKERQELKRERERVREKCNVARSKDWPKRSRKYVCKRSWVSGKGGKN